MTYLLFIRCYSWNRYTETINDVSCAHDFAEWSIFFIEQFNLYISGFGFEHVLESDKERSISVRGCHVCCTRYNFVFRECAI
jgi:hypothetical protein